MFEVKMYENLGWQLLKEPVCLAKFMTKISAVKIFLQQVHGCYINFLFGWIVKCNF